MGLVDRLRGPANLVALSASYVWRRPSRATSGARVAFEIGRRVRRAPVLRADPRVLASISVELNAADALVGVCSLVSDTHLTAGGAVVSELELDPGQWPWTALPVTKDLQRGVARVLSDIAARSPRTVVWCGDEVDTGQPQEWESWRAVIESEPGLAHRLVPGNHDICFNRPFDHDYDLARRASRERAYQQHAGRLADFPVLDTVIGDAGPATIILLDSCRHRSTHVLSNAVGMYGDDQLDELGRILDAVRGPVLCISHHHVWRDQQFLQPEAWYNTAVDADRLVAILGAYRRRDANNHVLVCHGHRHALTAGYVGDHDAPIAVVGLPSTTLGDKATTGRLDGRLRYAVAGLRRDRTGWGVAIRDVGALVERGHTQPAQPSIRPSRSEIVYAIPVQPRIAGDVSE